MKTKIIPFDLETAKKIQAGEIEGKITCHYGGGYKPARIICWDRIPSHPIVGLVKIGSCFESVFFFDKRGETQDNEKLVFEVPDNESKFKPFDRVLVRKDENDDGEPDTWVISYFMDESVAGYRVLNGEWFDQCIPYEGNEHLLGTTNKPKEE